jgi:hypothetical protein
MNADELSAPFGLRGLIGQLLQRVEAKRGKSCLSLSVRSAVLSSQERAGALPVALFLCPWPRLGRLRREEVAAWKSAPAINESDRRLSQGRRTGPCPAVTAFKVGTKQNFTCGLRAGLDFGQ